jgi:hypothetical protein
MIRIVLSVYELMCRLPSIDHMHGILDYHVLFMNLAICLVVLCHFGISAIKLKHMM